MGVYYYFYAEVKVGDQWYNISPLMRNSKGEVKVQPVLYGQSRIREAYEKMEDDCQYRGLPKDLSQELREIYHHDRDEEIEGSWNNMTYGEYYDKTIFVINYGAQVKGRVKKDIPARFRGYVNKYHLAAYEIGEIDEIINWIHPTEYEKLSPKQKKEYAYYEWNEWDDWYAVYTALVKRIDLLLDYFADWSFYIIPREDWSECSLTAESVRLIVERN